MPLADQCSAIFKAMGIEAQINLQMRSAITTVFQTALQGFDRPENVEFKDHPLMTIPDGLWPYLDEEFESGIAGSGLPPKQRKQWAIAYAAAKRVLTEQEDLGEIPF